jgi:hydrogenase maturation factor
VNLITGKIVEIYLEGGIAKAKLSVGGAYVRVPLMLLMDVRVGDEVLVEAGVAISKVEAKQPSIEPSRKGRAKITTS